MDKKNYYLVDFENVGMDALKTLDMVQSGDVLVLFYSEQCKNITIDIVDKIVKREIKLHCYKVKVGTKDALDFQLSSQLGWFIGKNGSGVKYYIVSKDKGFDCLCDYWKEQDISVERIVFVKQDTEVALTEKKQEKTKVKKTKVQSSDVATIKELNNILDKQDEPEAILEIVNKYKTKQAICNGIAKRFKDSKRASAVYKKLKPLLKEKNKS